MKFLTVYFGNKKIENDETVDLQVVQSKPNIKFNVPAGKYYTILMVDPDAPSKNHPDNKYWLHWMVVNNYNTIVDFKPSTPSPGTGEHRYYIWLLEQQQEIKVPNTYSRQKFPVKQFIGNYKLKPIAGVMYKTEKK
jgi:phosphatidylethanolamine-binding protein (PEBP) family uncharacterized protein